MHSKRKSVSAVRVAIYITKKVASFSVPVSSVSMLHMLKGQGARELGHNGISIGPLGTHIFLPNVLLTRDVVIIVCFDLVR